jgi:hypothetical protein
VQGKDEIENIRYAIKKSRPYGSEKWGGKADAKFGLESPLRDRGRPRKVPATFSSGKKVLATLSFQR